MVLIYKALLNLINFLIPKAHAQLRIMEEFRGIVCEEGMDPAVCMANLDLTAIIILINVVIRIALGFAGIVAVIFLIYSGYLFMISLGNPDALAKAKSKLLYTIIGLVVIICAYIIVGFILQNFGFEGSVVGNPLG